MYCFVESESGRIREVSFAVKYWKIIIENLRNAGWNCSYISSTDHEGRQFWVAAPERDGAGRFVVSTDEKLAAFVELESAIRAFESGALDVSDKFRHKKLWVGRYCFFGGKGYHESV